MNLNTLTSQNFEEIFNQIVEGNFGEAETKKFLLDLNSANLPQNAFIGAISSLRKKMKKISAPNNAIDVCGTGGDGLNTLNISTAVCFVVAAAGIPVAKHGNKAISSKSGSADIFSELGIKISSEVSEIEKNLREKNLCFLFAPFFHEALKNVAEIRKSLGVPTIFNFLGPLLNPANTKFQLIGVSRHDIMHKLSQTQLSTYQSPTKTHFVHGFDKMDEITLCDKSYLLRVEDGKILEEEIIEPQEYGFGRIKIENILGKDPKYNAQKLLELLNGEKSDYRNIVVLNSAFAFKLVDKVNNIEDGIKLAQNLIDNKKAISVMKALQS